MRTTLDIADDVLFAAKDFARRDKKSWVMSPLNGAALRCKTGLSQKKPGSARAKPKQVFSDEDQLFMTLGSELSPATQAQNL